MAKQPFYNIRVRGTGEDITNFITSFRFEDTLKKDDLITLEVTGQLINEFVDRNLLMIGDEIDFTFGFLGGSQSAKKIARVIGRNRSYKTNFKYTIKATDLGLLLKKADRYDDWSNNTSSDIVRQIAKRNGFLVEIDNTTTVHQIMPQGGKTDWEFIHYLASIEKDGLYRFYIQGETMFFTKRDLAKKARRKYDYDNHDFISFNVTENELTKKGGSKSSSLVTTDPENGTPRTPVVDNSNDKDVKLALYTSHINSRGVEQFTTPSVAQRTKNDNVGKQVVNGAVSDSEAENVSAYQKQKDSLNDISATLSLELEPNLNADDIITIQGIPNEDAGNWYVESVSHSISASGGSTSAKLKRNAANDRNTKGGNVKVTNPNKTVGDNKTTQSVNGEFINDLGETVGVFISSGG